MAAPPTAPPLCSSLCSSEPPPCSPRPAAEGHPPSESVSMPKKPSSSPGCVDAPSPVYDSERTRLRWPVIDLEAPPSSLAWAAEEWPSSPLTSQTPPDSPILDLDAPLSPLGDSDDESPPPSPGNARMALPASPSYCPKLREMRPSSPPCKRRHRDAAVRRRDASAHSSRRHRHQDSPRESYHGASASSRRHQAPVKERDRSPSRWQPQQRQRPHRRTPTREDYVRPDRQDRHRTYHQQEEQGRHSSRRDIGRRPREAHGDADVHGRDVRPSGHHYAAPHAMADASGFGPSAPEVSHGDRHETVKCALPVLLYHPYLMDMDAEASRSGNFCGSHVAYQYQHQWPHHHGKL